MMDTVLNLGLNDATVEGLGEEADDPRFAWDSYRRFIQMYGSVVLGVDHHRFEEIIEHTKLDTGVTEDTQLTAQDWHRVAQSYKDMIEGDTGKPFPQDPQEQLWGAIGAVFGSWMNPRANHLSPAARHPRRVGHRGERADHGVRQHGRRLRHRRVLHPRSVHRRERVLRRVPGERAGRGRGGRHPHAAAAVQAGAKPGETPLEAAMPEALRGTDAGPREAGAALPRHAGPRVHRAAEQAVHAADPQRQTHRRGERCASRWTWRARA